MITEAEVEIFKILLSSNAYDSLDPLDQKDVLAKAKTAFEEGFGYMQRVFLRNDPNTEYLRQLLKKAVQMLENAGVEPANETEAADRACMEQAIH